MTVDALKTVDAVVVFAVIVVIVIIVVGLAFVVQRPLSPEGRSVLVPQLLAVVPGYLPVGELVDRCSGQEVPIAFSVQFAVPVPSASSQDPVVEILENPMTFVVFHVADGFDLSVSPGLELAVAQSVLVAVNGNGLPFLVPLELLAIFDAVSIVSPRRDVPVEVPLCSFTVKHPVFVAGDLAKIALATEFLTLINYDVNLAHGVSNDTLFETIRSL